MEVLDFGYRLLIVTGFVVGLTALFALLGAVARSRRYTLAARSGFHITTILLLGVSATIVHGFVAGAYNNEYIFFHSEKNLFLGYKLAGIWAGLEGSLIFWTAVLAVMCSIVAIQHRVSARHAEGRRLEPMTYFVLSAVLGFFVMLSIRENAFKSMSMEHILTFAERYNVGIDSDGRLMDGKGLHPQLNNYWFVIHPPCLYFGLITFTVPFAFGLAALLSGELGSYWVKIARRWTLGLLDVPHLRHHPRRAVGVPAARLGGLLGLGSGRERLVSALVHRHRVPALDHDPGAPRHAQVVERVPHDLDVLPDDRGDFDDPRRARSRPFTRSRSTRNSVTTSATSSSRSPESDSSCSSTASAHSAERTASSRCSRGKPRSS